MASKRRSDYKFLYDRDDGLQQLHAQRVYEDTVSGTILTPITGKFAARVVPTDSKVERPKNLTKRHVIAYIDNPNVATGVSEMIQYIPYRAGDLDMTAQLREIEALPRVICQDFYGETVSKI
jgi:hypothetical protein